MSTDTLTWVGQTLGGGRYKVTAKLGEGGMGFVYKARDGNLDTDVVIKVPRGGQEDASKFVARFSREIKALVHLQHPHIVRVMDFGQHDGLPFAVIQYLPGGNLHERRPMGADALPVPILWNELGAWLTDIAEALDFIHRQGYVHRDIKPANILFDAFGNVFLSDFGIAKVLGATENADPSGAMTAQGMVVGTPEYMAPELVMGQPYDGRVDQYALAVLLYELLSGRRPFHGPTPWAVLVQHKTVDAPLLNEKYPFVPPSVAAAVKRALAKDPAQRFMDCAAFARAVLTPGPTLSKPSSLPPAPMGTPVSAQASDPGSLRVTCPACVKVFRVKKALAGKKVRCPTCQAVSIVPEELVPADPSNALTPTVKPAETPPMLQPVDEGPGPPLRRLDDLVLWPALGTLLGAQLTAMAAPLLLESFTKFQVTPEVMTWLLLGGGSVGMMLGILVVSLTGAFGNLLRFGTCMLGLGLPVLLLYPDVLKTKLSELGTGPGFGPLMLLIVQGLLILLTLFAWVRLFVLWRRRLAEDETSVFRGSQRLVVWLCGLGAVMVLLIGGVMLMGVNKPMLDAVRSSQGLQWLARAVQEAPAK